MVARVTLSPFPLSLLVKEEESFSTGSKNGFVGDCFTFATFMYQTIFPTSIQHVVIAVPVAHFSRQNKSLFCSHVLNATLLSRCSQQDLFPLAFVLVLWCSFADPVDAGLHMWIACLIVCHSITCDLEALEECSAECVLLLAT